jgi:predicted Zn-dependent protease
MAINKYSSVLLLLMAASAWSREAATPAECQSAASQPAISAAIAKVARNPDDLRAQVALADAWSDVGCYNDAVNVLQSAVAAHPENPELQTRLRVARSLVGEEHFFDDLDRADTQAKLKRSVFRCETLADLDACTDASRLKPDDPTLLVAYGDALMHAKRPADALQRYRRAEALAADTQGLPEKIRLAQTETTKAPEEARPNASDNPDLRLVRAAPKAAGAHRYSNAAPDGQSH